MYFSICFIIFLLPLYFQHLKTRKPLNFTYYILEDGKLCVGSQYGVDEDCTWSQDGDRIEFNFSDNAGITYIYDKENDKLICDGDDSWYLVRSEE